ncbi:Tll0287-like domain-containing protein [Gemmatimonas sp.]
MRPTIIVFVGPALAAGLLGLPTVIVAQPATDPLAKAVAEVERLDALRSALAATFQQSGAPADQKAFGEVCKPVGQTMQRVAAENAWTMRQISQKNRNPGNAADAEAIPHLQQFLRTPTLRSVVITTRANGKPALRYLRRITVEPSCLACHGERSARPAFIVQNYPQDRAFAFKAGDLRGAYSVLIPLADGSR